MPETLLTPQTPRLVEVQWFWRRSWSFLVTVVALLIVGFIVWALRGPGLADAQAAALQGVAYACLGVVVFIGLIYVVGATAYELVQLVQAAKVDLALRKGAP